MVVAVARHIAKFRGQKRKTVSHVPEFFGLPSIIWVQCRSSHEYGI